MKRLSQCAIMDGKEVMKLQAAVRDVLGLPELVMRLWCFHMRAGCHQWERGGILSLTPPPFDAYRTWPLKPALG